MNSINTRRCGVAGPRDRAAALHMLLLTIPILVGISPLIHTVAQRQLPAPIYAPAVVLLVVFLARVRRPALRRHMVVTTLRVAAAVTMLSGIVGLAWAPSRNDALRELAAVSISLLAAWTLARSLPGATSLLSWSLHGWTALWLMVFAGAAYEWLGGSPLITTTQAYSAFSRHLYTATPYTYVSSFLGNPNDLAGFLLVATPLVLAWLLIQKKRWQFLGIVAAFAIACVWTGSRTALAAVIPFVVMMLVFSPRRTSHRRGNSMTTAGLAIIALAGAIFCFAASSLAQRRVGALFAPFSADVSAQDQARAVWSAWAFDQMIHHYLIFGAGPGSFEFVAKPLGFYTNLHDSLLEIGFQYGLVAMVTVIVALAAVVVYGLRAAFTPGSHSARGVGAFAAMSISGLVLWSFTSSSILTNGYWGLALGNIAATAVLAHRTLRPAAPSAVDASDRSGDRDARPGTANRRAKQAALR